MRRPSRGSVLLSAAAVPVALAAVLTVAPGARASAAPPATVTADALPTWQIDGVVHDAITVGTTVYATGDFDRARPPGEAASATAGVARRNLLALDIRTGVVTGLRVDLNGPGRRLAASPDGRTVYVGGDFTRAGGKPRTRLAAIDTATGTVTGWAPAADGTVRALAATSSSVYVGGSFARLGGAARARVGAVSRATGKVTAWRPKVDRTVYALLAESSSRILVGGAFQKLNGTVRPGIGAVDAVKGVSQTWKSSPIPRATARNQSFVTDLIRYGSTVYGTANGDGTDWFDGRFAVRTGTGSLRWLDNCYGATYGAFAVGGVLYSAGHAHDCSSLGAFGETKPRSYHRALAETLDATGTDRGTPAVNSVYRRQPVPSLLTWFPEFNVGSATGKFQGPWTVTGNSDFVVMGGEFTRVNGTPQQGLVRFTTVDRAPNAVGPKASSGLTPKLVAGTGRVTVSWTRTWDQDDAKLFYTLERDGEAVVTAGSSSSFWKLGTMTFTDTDVPAGSHRYRVVVRDVAGNTVTGGERAVSVR